MTIARKQSNDRPTHDTARHDLEKPQILPRPRLEVPAGAGSPTSSPRSDAKRGAGRSAEVKVAPPGDQPRRGICPCPADASVPRLKGCLGLWTERVISDNSYMASTEARIPQFSMSPQQKSLRRPHGIVRALMGGGRSARSSCAENDRGAAVTGAPHLSPPVGVLRLQSLYAAVAPGDLVRWRGIVAEVTDVAHLGSNHDQVVLRRLDRRAMPISLPLSDLEGAQLWQFAGDVQLAPSGQGSSPG
jgi:hypothetical protein